MDVLVVDVGGSNVKVRIGRRGERLKIPCHPKMSAKRMAEEVRSALGPARYDAVSIGYPGVVKRGKPLREPVNLPRGWVGFDYRRAFGKPVRMINDAAMQALGAYRGGAMLFMGVGTGLGTALILDGVVHPTELGHLPYKKGLSYEQYLGKAGLARRGRKRWRISVLDVIARFQDAFLVDEIVLGGGNAKLLQRLPKGVRRGSNEDALVGGLRLWEGLR